LKDASARTTAVSWALIGGFGALVLWLGWRSRGWPLVHDAPIMHYIAWRLGEGAAPYRDVWDMNFPGVYLLHAAVLWLGGAGDRAWRVFDLAWLGLGCLAVAGFAASWGRVAAIGGALFYALHHLAAGPWQTGQRDFLLCPLLLFGALGVVQWIERRSSLFPLTWAGLALGLGITVKPHAALLAVALAVPVLREGWRSGHGPVRGLPSAVFVASVGLPVLAMVIWVAAHGALPAWRALLLDYLLPLYSGLRQAEPGFDRWHAWVPVGVSIALSVAAAAWSRRLGVRHWIALLGLGYGVVHFFIQGKGWEYHSYPAAAFAAVLLFAELEPLVRNRARAAIPLAASLALVAVLLGVKGAESAGAAEGGWVSAKAQRASALADALARHLEPGDVVQVLDTAGGGIHALLLLRVSQPTRFIYDFQFFHDTGTPVVQAMRTELVHGLRQRPPRCIVVFRDAWPAGGVERLHTFPELAGLLREEYRPPVHGDGYVIYAKRDGS
jgi:hypothetical protein